MTKLASLSSGYGGLEMALGMRATWHAEIDPDASLVLKTHEPDVPNLGDFTVPGFWESAERCAVHVGGIPCQPFSAAGRQQGTADARHLWPYWREGIALHRPATVVFENVANLTQGKMRPVFDAIIADLLSLGYDVRWCLLGACAVGAAHHRHRVFLLATRKRTHSPFAERVPWSCERRGESLLPTPRAIDAVRGPVTAARTEASGRANGVELASALNADFGKYAEAIARHAAVLGRPAPEPTEIGPRGGRRLAATFSEWLMMLPAGHLTDILPRNPALARAGNGVVPLQAATALGLLRAEMP